MTAFDEVFNKYRFIVFAIGSALLSVALEIVSSNFPSLFSHAPIFLRFLPHLLADGALIFFSAEMVERTLLSNFNQKAEERSSKLGQDLEKKVERTLLSSLDDMRYAEHYNVHFLPPRRSKTRCPRPGNRYCSGAG